MNTSLNANAILFHKLPIENEWKICDKTSATNKPNAISEHRERLERWLVEWIASWFNWILLMICSRHYWILETHLICISISNRISNWKCIHNYWFHVKCVILEEKCKLCSKKRPRKRKEKSTIEVEQFKNTNEFVPFSLRFH